MSTQTDTAPTESIEIRPQPAQLKFLSSSADLTFYGGGAFGGKTYAALLDLVRWHHLPRYRGVLFRRTHPQITSPGGVWDESQTLYRLFNGHPNLSTLTWKFPSGAIIGMRGCQHEKDIFNFKSMQADVITFEQLEDFESKQFWYLLSRNRGSSGIRSYVRANYNPQPGWLADLLQWWWNPINGYAIKERAGIIRWMARVNDQIYWANSRDELERICGSGNDFDPKTVTFIPASAEDNPIGLAQNPSYIANLKAGRRVDMERLLKGNHKIRDDEGAEWPSEYFEDVWAEIWPQQFELSAIAVDVSKGGKDGDYSAIVFGGLLRGLIYVDSDIQRRPVPEIVADAAAMCIANRAQAIGFESNGFQELVAPEYERYVQKQSLPIPSADLIPNYTVKKEVRIQRLGGYLKGKRFKFRRCESNNLLMDQLTTFPMNAHDDGPDAMEMMLRHLNKMAADMMEGVE